MRSCIVAGVSNSILPLVLLIYLIYCIIFCPFCGYFAKISLLYQKFLEKYWWGRENSLTSHRQTEINNNL